MMQFWGVEVKNGNTLKVEPGDEKVVHLSQACLGEIKKDKGNEFIRVFVRKNEQKFVIGILSPEKFPHINLDLVFEDEFELSHDWKHGSVHFTGYKADNPVSMLDDDESDDEVEEPIPVEVLNNGKPEAKESKASGDKPKVKIVEPAKEVEKDEDEDETEDDDEEDDSEEDEEEEDEDLQSSEGGSDEEDESDEEEQTPEKPEPSKKRVAGSTSKTPVPDKKAKFDTPQQKADGKKVSGHVATPHPAKQTAKTPANAEKSSKQTPKGGSVTCTSCNRSFGSFQALQSHSKAKHGAK